ncbi:MAG: hypothetical protein K0S81_1651 [Rhodospirillales bacterium]|nr:hypothetical protein [Rhodospirillales bacterium]
MPRSAFLIGLAALALVGPAAGADIDARTMGAIADVLAPAGSAPPPGVDPEIYARAVEALKAERLLGLARPPQPADAALLTDYGKALLLGQRAGELGTHVGAVHDAVLSGQRDAISDAIGALYQAAGRPVPQGEAMDRLVDAARGVGGAEPAPTVRQTLEREGYTVELTDAVAAGKTAVEVLLPAASGHEPARVLFEGSAKTEASPDRKGLEHRIQPAAPCVVTAASAAAAREALNGAWTGSDGSVWAISGAGDAIQLVGTRADGHRLDYQGTIRLGKIDARHAISHVADMGEGLPLEVRSQLAGMGLFFTLRLETCGSGSRLAGLWGSQHVTYGALDLQVSKVHDPYDQQIVLTREAGGPELRFVIAEGGGYRPVEGALPYGEPIFLEALYPDPQDEAEKVVDLSWPGGAVPVPVARTGDPKLYRSASILLDPPAAEGEVQP